MTLRQSRQWNKLKRKYLFAPKGQRSSRLKELKDMTTKLLREGA